MPLKTTRGALAVAFALVSVALGASASFAAAPVAVSPAASMPFVVAMSDSDQSDADWASHGTHSLSVRQDCRPGQPGNSAGHRQDCQPSPTPVPTIAPSPTPAPTSTPVPCTPSSVSGSYVPTFYDPNGAGTLSFNVTCPSSSASTFFMTNLTGVASPFNVAGTQVGLFVGNTLVSYGTVDSGGNVALVPPSYFDPTVPQYLPAGISVVSGTQIDFWTFSTTGPLNCYPCSQTVNTTLANNVGSVVLQ